MLSAIFVITSSESHPLNVFAPDFYNLDDLDLRTRSHLTDLIGVVSLLPSDEIQSLCVA